MTARIEIRLNGEDVSQHTLPDGRLTIGRGADVDLQLDDDGVSAAHAAIETDAEQSVIRDLDSANGTLVDDIDVEEHTLEHGEIIGIGPYELTFLNDDQVASSAEDNSVFDLPPIDEDAFVEVDAPLRAVEALNGPGKGSRLELKNARTALGLPSIQVVMIARGPNGYLIKGSKGSQPIVNRRLTGPSAHPLEHGDVIEVAGTRLRFVLLSTDSQAV